MNPATQTASKLQLSPLAPDFFKVGFIGQGYIGKNYADDFERRGISVVRYALEEPFRANRGKIKECKVVFIAVPTPTTPDGFDDHIVREALSLVPDSAIAVIKSTVIPGSTANYQKLYPKITVLYSPEFLSETTAASDAQNPFSNVIGLPVDDEIRRVAADIVLSVLPKASFQLICTSTEAEFIKYSHNLSGYVQIVLFNALYDAARELGADWTPVNQALKADPYVPNRYSQPVHKSGRGAGGGCFIKDFAAFRSLYQTLLPGDARGLAMLKALEQKNIELLQNSGKDSTLLKGVYGGTPLAAAAPSFNLSRFISSIPYAAQLMILVAGFLVIVAGTLDIATRFIGVILR